MICDKLITVVVKLTQNSCSNISFAIEVCLATNSAQVHDNLLSAIPVIGRAPSFLTRFAGVRYVEYGVNRAYSVVGNIARARNDRCD